MYEEVGKPDECSHYSDVTEAGGLGAAVQAHLEAIGSPLRVKKDDSEFAGLFPFAWEVIQQGQRFSQINIAKHQRLFMMDFWDRGVCLAHASTPILAKVAEVIDSWIAKEATTVELQRQFPFVSVEPTADSHEKGAAVEVERKWQALYEYVKRDEYKAELIPLVEKAMDVPSLRRLFPFTSLNSLCFSRCTGYPFSGDCPSACPIGKGRYSISGPKGNDLAEGDAAEAIKLLVENLPADCGPAVQGTADDLH